MRKVSYLSLSITAGCLLLSACATFHGPGSAPSPAVVRPPMPKQFTVIWPVKRVQINRGFDVQKRHPHLGLDLGGSRGTPIVAAHAGEVIYVGRRYKGYGRMVIIEYSPNWATLYGHLNSFSVRQGDFVQQGEVIGQMGRSGHATGVHLHFELLREKTPVDPLLYLDRPSAHP